MTLCTWLIFLTVDRRQAEIAAQAPCWKSLGTARLGPHRLFSDVEIAGVLGEVCLRRSNRRWRDDLLLEVTGLRRVR